MSVRIIKHHATLLRRGTSDLRLGGGNENTAVIKIVFNCVGGGVEGGKQPRRQLEHHKLSINQ